MSSDRMETEQVSQSNSGDFREQIAALEQCGFKKYKYNYKLLKRTGGNLEVVKAFLEAEEKASQTRRDERKKRRSHDSSSSSSSSDEEKPWKKEKREKKEHKKDEKHKSKVYKKIEKKDWKERKHAKANPNDNAQQITENVNIISLGNQWPAEGSNLYLDGNNMLFVLGPIRKLALQGRRSDAELVLQRLAEEFAKKMGLTRCTLIYDTTNKNVVTSSFVVCSARPQFATSDDALVEWASQPGGKGLYVTSDRELIQRLSAVGSHICKPKQWFTFVASTLANAPVENLDNWIQTWMDKQDSSVQNYNSI